MMLAGHNHETEHNKSISSSRHRSSTTNRSKATSFTLLAAGKVTAIIDPVNEAIDEAVYHRKKGKGHRSVGSTST
jgi:hypothetical protein